MKVPNWLSVASVPLLATIGVLSVCTTGCSVVLKGDEYQRGQSKQLHAYGSNWTFRMMDREDSQIYLHGLAAGGAARPRHLLYLDREDGKSIPLSDMVYVPQKDGSLKKVAGCCDAYLVSDQALQEFEGKLILHFDANWRDVTDCPTSRESS